MVVTNLKKPPEFLKFHTNSRFGTINSFPLRGIWVQILRSQKNLHDFEALLSCCMWALCLLKLQMFSPSFSFLLDPIFITMSVTYSTWKKNALPPTQIQPSPRRGIAIPANFSESLHSNWVHFRKWERKKREDSVEIQRENFF